MYSQKIILLLIISLITQFVSAQFSYGVKAGLNYDSIGELTAIEQTSTFNADAKTGFHLGVYSNINLLLFYLRPELQFTKSESSFGENGSLSFSKIEAPILLGYKVLGPLSVFAGPSFQYILSEKTEILSVGEIDENFTVGLQIGTRLKLGRFGIGIRFERGFTDNEVTLLESNNIDVAGRIDTRSKQWVISASYKLDFKKKD